MINTAIVVPKRKKATSWFNGLDKEMQRAFLDYCRYHLKLGSDEAVRQYIRGDKEAAGKKESVMQEGAKLLGFKSKQIWD